VQGASPRCQQALFRQAVQRGRAYPHGRFANPASLGLLPRGSGRNPEFPRAGPAPRRHQRLPNASYSSRRPSIDSSIVASSMNSRSLPIGMPMPMRVTRTPSGLSSRAR